MTIANKLRAIASTKEALRVKLELDTSVPFYQYANEITGTPTMLPAFSNDVTGKLAKLAYAKESLRQALGLSVDTPFSEYVNYARWSLVNLFVNNEKGVFYEPYDIEDLYQDASGTVPVKASGDPVGLILDKSQNVLKDGELVVNGTFDIDTNGWQQSSLGHWQVVNSRSYHPLSSEYKHLLQDFVGLTGVYEISFDTVVLQGALQFFYRDSNNNLIKSKVFNQGEYNFKIIIFNGLNSLAFSRDGGILTEAYVDNVSVKDKSSSYARQSISASRPIYQTDGSKSWLYHDKVDDKMLATLPAMTATVVTATDDGVAINYPISIAAGNYVITNNSTLGRDYGRLIIDRALTAIEQSQVTKYFNTKRGV